MIAAEMIVIDHLATKLALCGRTADRQGPCCEGASRSEKNRRKL